MKYAIVGNPLEPGEMCVIGTYETREAAERDAALLREKFPEAGNKVVPFFESGVMLP